jgi:DNA topoisomerase I
MEGELDRVEDGEADWREVLEEFYPDFRGQLEKGKASSDEIVKELLAAEGETCEKCGSPMLVKWNRFGRFLGCSAYPECQSTRSLDGPGEASQDLELGVDPRSGETVFLKDGPYGPYVQLGEGAKGEKPPRASLPSGQKPEETSLDFALKLLSLPRDLGTDPESGKKVLAGLGRYGPYVNRERTYRNLDRFEQVFEVTLEEALELLAKKQGPAVLKELGKHPETGKTLEVLDGRYGPYVTDGEVNASLAKGADPQELEMEEAVELLAAAAKRGKGRKGRKGGGSKGGRSKGGGSKSGGPKGGGGKRGGTRGKKGG